MKRVMVLNGSSSGMLEGMVNEFIKRENVVSIQYQANYAGHNSTNYSAMIIYER